MHIADMARSGRDDHALGRAALGRDHEIIARQVQFFQRARHQSQVFLVMFTRARESRDPGLENRAPGQRALELRAVGHVGEDVGVRIEPQ